MVRRSSFSRIISTWHSGSPKRTLYSMSFGPLGVDHQPGIEHAAIGDAAAGERGDGRPDDLRHHALGHRVGQDRRRRIGAHAAGVRALVAVEGALVVLRRAEGDDGLAVGEREEARLLALQEILDHQRRAGVARRSRRSPRAPSPGRAATVTPLPAASPSAFTTIGRSWCMTIVARGFAARRSAR